MKITFLGTRGYIDVKTPRHRRHTSTIISRKGKRIMIDCGQDWLKKVWVLKPDAIVITHAHPDHAWGLKNGAPCPVYATKESWALMEKYPIKERHTMEPRKKVEICGVIFETFPVIHSLLAPGVGYRITAEKTSIFVVHDLISIDDRYDALKNVKLYVGDGATIVRPMVRRKGDKLFGHTTIRAQLGWCQKEGVPLMVVTHCGTQIVAADGRTVNARIKSLAQERGVEVKVAYDGMKLEV
ncbi:MAG: MBL fold metallo-hydrolase [Candidatus Dependentiae bacterium]|nr:MBL fold metallo-hydrolase [Candidatus Dependentiae bacterium]